MKNIFSFIFSFAFIFTIFINDGMSQYHSLKTGDWADDDTWVDEDSPPTNGKHDNLIIFINRVWIESILRHDSVYYTGDLNYHQSTSLTLNVNGTLIIHGKIDVHNHLKVNVGDHGIFILKGSLNFHNDAKLTLNGNMQVDEINGMDNSNGNTTGNNEVEGSGHLWVTNGPGAVSGVDLDDFLDLGGTVHYEEYPLPVELLSFTGKSQTSGVALNWVTATETNNRGFEIQRMHDSNQHWEQIGWVDGHYNHNGILRYEYRDAAPDKGINYYRLRQVDYDGAFEYHGPVAIRYDPEANPKDFTVHRDAASLHIAMEGHDQCLVEVYDLSGRQLVSRKAVHSASVPAPQKPVIVRITYSSGQVASRIVR